MALYYDVDAILTDSQVRTPFRLWLANPFQKVPCTFEMEVPGIGYLQGNPGDSVRPPSIAHTLTRPGQAGHQAGAPALAGRDARHQVGPRLLKPSSV